MMLVRVTDLYHDRVDGTFQGTPDEVLLKLVERYPWAARGTADDVHEVVKAIGRAQAFKVEVE